MGSIAGISWVAFLSLSSLGDCHPAGDVENILFKSVDSGQQP